uniref:Uncharacterized protein n=1 Tax=Sphaerodactylus townsendi TaxID=933632 RepID=A0ACB8FLS0_9SAUR
MVLADRQETSWPSEGFFQGEAWQNWSASSSRLVTGVLFAEHQNGLQAEGKTAVLPPDSDRVQGSKTRSLGGPFQGSQGNQARVSHDPLPHGLAEVGLYGTTLQ